MSENLLEMTHEQLRSVVTAADQPAYRADQLADWVYNKAVSDPSAMTNLPDVFVKRFDILTSRIARRSESADGTVKLLLELSDCMHTECVAIPAGQRNTACISTQVGCAMGCRFCASATSGLQRNLTCSEILQQIIHLTQATGRRITHVVIMGMGEPLANYDSTVAALRAIIDPERFNISARRVTVSTVGLPKQIEKLAGENLPITLAISLHAPNDTLRRQIVPAAEGSAIEDIIQAAKKFYAARKREVTLEYVLLAGVNDTPACADQLADIAHSLRSNVNVIAYNRVEGLDYQAPSPVAVKAFAQRLKKRGVNVHVRRSRGADIDAACGQLRLRHENDTD